jgi:arylsulfatase A-like enzyme
MSVDDLVQAVMSELTKIHQADDTLAFFLSDNGYMWGEHGLVADKRWPHTESVEVPWLMRWPATWRLGPWRTDWWRI